MPVEERKIGPDLPGSFRNQYTAAAAIGGDAIIPEAVFVED